uniref:Uncharacterized protein n=1 Tax=Glossina brevipalpis TaxID=37001 RepID=A0A1A9W0F6_9MUSC
MCSWAKLICPKKQAKSIHKWYLYGAKSVCLVFMAMQNIIYSSIIANRLRTDLYTFPPSMFNHKRSVSFSFYKTFTLTSMRRCKGEDDTDEWGLPWIFSTKDIRDDCCEGFIFSQALKSSKLSKRLGEHSHIEWDSLIFNSVTLRAEIVYCKMFLQPTLFNKRNWIYYTSLSYNVHNVTWKAIKAQKMIRSHSKKCGRNAFSLTNHNHRIAIVAKIKIQLSVPLCSFNCALSMVQYDLAHLNTRNAIIIIVKIFLL